MIPTCSADMSLLILGEETPASWRVAVLPSDAPVWVVVLLTVTPEAFFVCMFGQFPETH